MVAGGVTLNVSGPEHEAFANLRRSDARRPPVVRGGAVIPATDILVRQGGGSWDTALAVPVCDAWGNVNGVMMMWDKFDKTDGSPVPFGRMDEICVNHIALKLAMALRGDTATVGSQTSMDETRWVQLKAESDVSRALRDDLPAAVGASRLPASITPNLPIPQMVQGVVQRAVRVVSAIARSVLQVSGVLVFLPTNVLPPTGCATVAETAGDNSVTGHQTHQQPSPPLSCWAAVKRSYSHRDEGVTPPGDDVGNDVNSAGGGGGGGRFVPVQPQALLMLCGKNGSGDVGEARDLLARGINIDEQDKNDQTALMKAALYGRVEVVKELVRAGATLDAQDTKWGKTALQIAQKKGHTEIIAILENAPRERKEETSSIRAYWVEEPPPSLSRIMPSRGRGVVIFIQAAPGAAATVGAMGAIARDVMDTVKGGDDAGSLRTGPETYVARTVANEVLSTGKEICLPHLSSSCGIDDYCACEHFCSGEREFAASATDLRNAGCVAVPFYLPSAAQPTSSNPDVVSQGSQDLERADTRGVLMAMTQSGRGRRGGFNPREDLIVARLLRDTACVLIEPAARFHRHCLGLSAHLFKQDRDLEVLRYVSEVTRRAADVSLGRSLLVPRRRCSALQLLGAVAETGTRLLGAELCLVFAAGALLEHIHADDAARSKLSGGVAECADSLCCWPPGYSTATECIRVRARRGMLGAARHGVQWQPDVKMSALYEPVVDSRNGHPLLPPSNPCVSRLCVPMYGRAGDFLGIIEWTNVESHLCSAARDGDEAGGSMPTASELALRELPIAAARRFTDHIASLVETTIDIRHDANKLAWIRAHRSSVSTKLGLVLSAGVRSSPQHLGRRSSTPSTCSSSDDDSESDGSDDECGGRRRTTGRDMFDTKQWWMPDIFDALARGEGARLFRSAAAGVSTEEQRDSTQLQSKLQSKNWVTILRDSPMVSSVPRSASEAALISVERPSPPSNQTDAALCTEAAASSHNDVLVRGTSDGDGSGDRSHRQRSSMCMALPSSGTSKDAVVMIVRSDRASGRFTDDDDGAFLAQLHNVASRTTAICQLQIAALQEELERIGRIDNVRIVWGRGAYSLELHVVSLLYYRNPTQVALFACPPSYVFLFF